MSMHKFNLIISAGLALVVSTLGTVGCSWDEQADVAGLSRYTPEILAQEVLTIYKASHRRPPASAKAKEASKADRGRIGDGGDGDKEAAIAAAYGDKFRSRTPVNPQKTEKGISLDEFAKNVARKAKRIEGETPQAVLSKLSNAVDDALDLSSTDRDRLKSALKSAFGG